MISMYKFKPFQCQILNKNLNPCDQPHARSGHHVVSNNAYVISYGGYTLENANGPQRLSGMRELWKYCLDLEEWRKIACTNIPQELAFSSILLSGNIILIYGGTGVPFGEICSNHMYLGNLANEFTEDGMKFEKLQVTGDVPKPLYGQSVAIDGKYIYSLGGLSASGLYEMDVHALDLSTKKWVLLYKSCEPELEPDPRYPHEVVFYKSKIYVFGDSRGVRSDELIANVHNVFQKIYIFDVNTKKWQLELAKPDDRVPKPGYPSYRSYHSCVQCPEIPNLVYLSGGYIKSIKVFRDVWRFDIDHLQWENLTKFVLPWPVFYHSTTITPSGRMCNYGGIVRPNNSRGDSSNDIVSVWITIPKLKVIAWEALIYYFKDQMFASTDDDLKKSGIPKEYYDRIIEERRIHKICPLKNN